MFRLACAAPNCLMRTYDFTKEQSKLVKNNYTVSFHKFPRNAEHRSAWIAAAKKCDWNPSLDDSLCSLHFGDDCFDLASQLYDHAIPTIFFDDFRSYIKNLAKEINLEVDLESSDENEDILSKSLKSIGPLASDDIDDGDQIVECEISISDDDDTEIILPEGNSEKNESTSSQSLVTEPVVRNECVGEKEKPATLARALAGTSNNAKKTISSTASAVAKNTNSNSGDVMQTKLYSLVQNGSLDKNSLVEPTTSNFVLQLLNIVKMANLQNASIDSSVPNTYLITTRQEKSPKDREQSVTIMETSEIISLITKSVKMIKTGDYRKCDLLTIICASPTIFLIKNVAVRSFDANMNSVYVVTSENLIKPLALLNAKLEKDATMKFTKSANPVCPISSKTSLEDQKIESGTPASKTLSRTQSSKPGASLMPSRPLKSITSSPNFLSDATTLGNVKIDLKAIKADHAVAQSLKNLNLSGFPTLLQNVGSTKQNVLKLNISSPVPSALVPVANKSNVIRLNLSSPMAIPKGAVYCAENKFSAANGDTTNQDVEDGETETPPAKKPAIDQTAYLKNQKREIARLEGSILYQEREIGLLKKKMQMLKKRHLAVKNRSDTKSDEQIVDDILNKYLDQDAAQFFISQMKVSGKTYTQFRWSEEDKLFALGLLYKHPTEYNILFQKFTLPSDKTLSKFVSKIKKAEQDVKGKKL